MLADSLAVTGLSKGLGLKRSGTELTILNQTDLGQNCRKKDTAFRTNLTSDIPCYQRLGKKRLGSTGGGKTTMHFNGSTENIELLLQMVISVNQLSIYGAVADMFEELAVGQKAPVKPAAPGQLDKVEILAPPRLAEYEQRFEKCQKTRSYPNYAPKQV